MEQLTFPLFCPQHTAWRPQKQRWRGLSRAATGLGKPCDLRSKQTWCSDLHWKTTVLLLPASQWEYLRLKNSLHSLPLPTTAVGRSARQISNDVKWKISDLWVCTRLGVQKAVTEVPCQSAQIHPKGAHTNS